MDILTIGDALVAFNPTTTGPMRFAHTFERKVGGAELNVAIGCSRLGLRAGWISRLGKDEFGRYVLNTVRGEGVDVTQVKLVEGYPTSLYFKEILNGEKINSYYYRNPSPTLSFKDDGIDENYIKQAKILHITGVFPAVTESNREVLLDLLKVTKQHHVLVTLDPNIRLKLWTAEEARQTLHSYLPYVDVLIAGEEETEILFGTSDPDEVFEAAKSFGVEHVIVKQGERGATGYRGAEKVYTSVETKVNVVDVIGAGDGFAAGYLYSLIQNWSLEQSLKYANAVAGRVIGVQGDNEGLPYKEDLEVFLGEKTEISR